MWDHLPVRNLIDWQRIARLKELERQMVDDLRAGYGVDADAGLDEWISLQDAMMNGPVA